jgi:hypothetical protein
MKSPSAFSSDAPVLEWFDYERADGPINIQNIEM